MYRWLWWKSRRTERFSWSGVNASTTQTTAPFNRGALPPADTSLATKQTQQPSVPSPFMVSHPNSCGAVILKRRRMPTPLSSLLRTRELPHPNGCSSQLCPLLQGMMRFIGRRCVVFFVCVSFSGFWHNSATSRSYWELHIWACCSWDGETFYAFSMNLARVERIEMANVHDISSVCTYTPAALIIRVLR